MDKYLYVMLSRTDTGMGRMIRRFTKGQYNHVSLGLDSSLGAFVSFARYRKDVALAGGYVTEPAARILASGAAVPVKVFRLALPEGADEQLIHLFQLAGDRSTGLIYNSLGALFTTWGLPCPVPGAYTCLDFAGVILGQAFPSLQALEAELEPWLIYDGDYRGLVPHKISTEDPFFEHRGVLRGIGDTAAHFGRLLLRLLRLQKVSDPLKFYDGKVLEYNRTLKVR